MIQTLLKKFTEKPVYNPMNDHPIVRYITKYPTLGYISFVFLKGMTGYNYRTSQYLNKIPSYLDYLYILGVNMSFTLVYDGILPEYIQSKWVSIFLQGLVYSFLPKYWSINMFVYGITRGLACRRYSLMYMMFEKIFFIIGSFLFIKLLE